MNLVLSFGFLAMRRINTLKVCLEKSNKDGAQTREPDLGGVSELTGVV